MIFATETTDKQSSTSDVAIVDGHEVTIVIRRLTGARTEVLSLTLAPHELLALDSAIDGWLSRWAEVYKPGSPTG